MGAILSRLPFNRGASCDINIPNQVMDFATRPGQAMSFTPVPGCDSRVRWSRSGTDDLPTPAERPQRAPAPAPMLEVDPWDSRKGWMS
jgi:hypothetical protein